MIKTFYSIDTEQNQTMGNAQDAQRDVNTMNISLRVSDGYQLKNAPSQPPYIWRDRIDQQLWDEFYQEVMSCAAYGMNHNLNKQHKLHTVFRFIAGIVILTGMMDIC